MKRLLVLTTALAISISAQAEVQMPKFFSDNMVLQRERPIRVWGHASKNELVTVRFAEAEVSAKADRTGRRSGRRVALQRTVEYGVAARSNDRLRN